MRRKVLMIWVLSISATLLLLLLPRLISGSRIILATEILYFSLYSVSFNLLFGYGGLLPFGHGGLFGMGAYTTGILLARLSGLPILLTIFLSGIFAMIVGAIIGFFSLRLKGAFFSLLTFAFQMFLFALALKWRPVTGGEDGISVLRPEFHLPLLGAISLADRVNFYYFSLVMVTIVLALSYWFLKTPFGNSIRCIKENEERASFLGYQTYRSQFILFCVASFIAGVGGSLSTLTAEMASLEAINVDVSFAAIMMTFIGGAGSFLGPVLGSAFYVVFQDWLSSWTDRWLIFMGALFIVMVLYLDSGLISLLKKETYQRLWLKD